MEAKGLTPILDVLDIASTIAWFEKWGWKKLWDWGTERRKDVKPLMFTLMVVVMAVISFSACGGGSTPAPPPITYTIGGTVSALSGTQLVLQNNGGNNLPVSANGAFTFSTPIASGDRYNVTVLTQPSSPAQFCSVTNGGGTANETVTNVQVTCVNEWVWVNGASVANQKGAYGTQGTAAASNVPGARLGALSWTDAAGNLWLFGGTGFDSAGNFNELNDLWKYSAGKWTWMGGSNVGNQPGTYGTQGTPSPNNIPGARQDAVSWLDAAGDLWLFGGFGLDSFGTVSVLNDLWKYSAGQWTWMGGSDVVSQYGTYGTKGTPAASNIPGARHRAVSWTDGAGSFWFFGGVGLDSVGADGELNDLWKYSAGQWTWMGGSNVVDQPGTYGTQGTATPTNVPGGRDSAVSWIDTAGNFWLFGGYGYDSNGALGEIGELNDLWKYSASSGEWSWMGGSNLDNQPGTYGTQGMAAPGNVPGARENAVGWIDAAGNLWLFGGGAYNSGGGPDLLSNDLWKYSAGEWTWINGPNVVNQPGIYGTQGTAANVPGARYFAVSWTDTSGNLWLFGGIGYDSTGALGELNDLWRYEP
jgi:N-acetylneuraminic acid mutarotase